MTGATRRDLIPRLAVDGRVEAPDRSYARGVGLDLRRRLGPSRGGRLGPGTEDAARLLGERGRALPFV